MKTQIKNKKVRLLHFFLPILLFVFALFNGVQAECVNTVPNPLNPDCRPDMRLSIGSLMNKFIGALPIFVTVLAAGAIARSAIIIIFTTKPEKRSEAFKGIMYAAAGAALFYSIWLILFLIEYFTGGNLIPFNI